MPMCYGERSVSLGKDRCGFFRNSCTIIFYDSLSLTNRVLTDILHILASYERILMKRSARGGRVAHGSIDNQISVASRITIRINDVLRKISICNCDSHGQLCIKDNYAARKHVLSTLV